MAAGGAIEGTLSPRSRPSPPRGSLRGVARTIRRDRYALAGLVVLVLFALLAIFAPELAPYDLGYFFQPDRQPTPHLPPFWAAGHDPRFLLGTDSQGIDLVTVLLLGVRTSMAVGLGAVAVLSVMGIGAGLAAGWFGGRWDTVIMRVADITDSVPSILGYLLVGMLITNTLGQASYEHMTILMWVVLSSVGWAYTARMTRGHVLALKEQEFVVAARSLGMRPSRLLLRHVLPNSLGTALVTASYQVPGLMVANGFLASVHAGLGEPMGLVSVIFSEWGEVVFYPHETLLPTLALLLISLAFTALGDGLQRALNPWEADSAPREPSWSGIRRLLVRFG